MWYFQPSPHDTHDWDAVQTPVLFDGEFTAGRASCWRRRAATDTSSCWIAHWRAPADHAVHRDELGKRHRSSAAVPKPGRQGAEARRHAGECRARTASTNWMAPSFSPERGLFYVSCAAHLASFLPDGGRQRPKVGAGATGLWAESMLRRSTTGPASNRWSHELGKGAA